MKSLRLILNVYRKNILSSIFLLFIFTISIYLAGSALGQYRQIVYTKNQFAQANLEDSLYYMPNGFGSEIVTWSMQQYNEEVEKVFNKTEKIPGVQSLIKGPDNFGQIRVFNDPLIKAFPLDLRHGKQLDETSNSDPEDENGVDAIVGGPLYKNVKVGDILTIPLMSRKNGQIKIHVIGKTSNLLYLPDFGRAGTSISAQDFLNWEQEGTIICRSSPSLLSFLSKHSIPSTDPNFFVNTAPNLSQQEKQELINTLNQEGQITTYQEIMDNTNETISYTMKSQMPLPMFFLIISTISLISISVLFVFKNIKRNSIYYLCGCNRKKGFFYIACGISLISIIAGIINTIMICYMDSILSKVRLTVYQYRFDAWSIGFVYIYIIPILILSIGIPYLVYRRMSPIELYRRVQ